MTWETVIGLEVHVELLTRTKMFCSCTAAFGGEPNTHCCPVCMGMPGTLPVLNGEAVRLATMAALALGCTVTEHTRFDRKNYFYPDVPKAFQISQKDPPLCFDGFVKISTDNDDKKIRISRIHIEEDAGKLIHDAEQNTLIDYNRCGTPLIEIVSAPDISSGEEAKKYLKALRTNLLYIGISDCKMNEGSMRCDVNVSVKEKGSNVLGERVEIKNINSIAFVGKAIDAEFERMVSVLKSGGKIERETRRYNAQTGKTESMRSKEDIADYRFFTEPDILPILIEENVVESIKAKLPTMPDERMYHYVNDFHLSDYDSSVLSSDVNLSNVFDKAAELTEYKKVLANIMLGEILRLCESEDFACPISHENIAELATLVGEDKISNTTAKKLVGRMWQNDTSPKKIVDDENLYQINDEDILRELVREAIEANQRSVDDYKHGKKNALKAIMGYIMAKTRGLVNPQTTEKLLLDVVEK